MPAVFAFASTVRIFPADRTWCSQNITRQSLCMAVSGMGMIARCSSGRQLGKSFGGRRFARAERETKDRLRLYEIKSGEY